MDNETLWKRVLTVLELSISPANFSIIFRPTFIVKREDGIITLGVPNPFIRDWVVEKFHKLILKSLRETDEMVRGLEYTIVKDGEKKKVVDQQEKKASVPINTSAKELPLTEQHYINREDNLNPRYTFDSFVVGPFNELAFAASQAIIKNPVSYNPLFFYGSTGHGKTHLIQSIGNHLKKGDSNKKVYYVTSEKFSQDVVSSIMQNKPQLFKEKYRKYDVFIMDDIQFLSNKEKTQEELFHLFNYLYDNNKQIVFSSDQHPNYIPNLEDRLKSRFVSGMIVDIPPPDHESRMAILKTKAINSNVLISDEVLQYLATTIEGNIRELEGVLNTIICQMQLKNRELNLLEIKSLIKNSTKPIKTVSVKDVIKIVSQFYNTDEESIIDKTRRKEVVKPRQVVMYILREDYSISFPSIGEKLGGRDHTTVIHSCEKIKNDLKNNNLLAQEIQQIRSLL